MRIAWTIGAFLGCCIAACAGPRDTSPWAPRPVREQQSWEVRARDRVVGRVVAYEIEDPEAPQLYYQVLNADGQWLGYVDEQLRVYQRVPFSMTEVFRGVHPMEQGLALLFEETEPLALVSERPDGPAEAAARTGRE